MIRKVLVYEVAYVVVCKHCGKEGPIGYTENTAYSKARKEGWTFVGEDGFCPEHVKSPFKRQSRLAELGKLLHEIEHKDDPPEIDE